MNAQEEDEYTLYGKQWTLNKKMITLSTVSIERSRRRWLHSSMNAQEDDEYTQHSKQWTLKKKTNTLINERSIRRWLHSLR